MDTLQGMPAFRSVVLIADVIGEDEPSDDDLAARRDLEQTEASTLTALVDAVRELGIDIIHYQSPEELGRNAQLHGEDLVLSVYGGSSSRNRMALVPAICETYGIRFVGPDTYGRIIAQDKEVSKRLALDCGLRTPNWRVIRDEQTSPAFGAVAYPCVVKPLLEGSSIGITQANLARSPADAAVLCGRLLRDFAQPVLIEEFVSGRETSFCAIQNGADIEWAYSEMIVEGDPDFFTQRLFDVVEKQRRTIGRTVRNIDSELAANDLEGILRLLRAYGPFGYCRVDGRHRDGEFHFLELTPDAWLHPLGQFAMAFTERGWTYSKVISALLTSGG